jgi:hypothetical protein
MQSISFHTVLLLICALVLAPLSPAFAQASASAQHEASTCAPVHATIADAHSHHADADGPTNADSDCGQHDACAGACCAQCAHCFVAAMGTHTTEPAGLAVFSATRPTGRSRLVSDLLERPPRLLA